MKKLALGLIILLVSVAAFGAFSEEAPAWGRGSAETMEKTMVITDGRWEEFMTRIEGAAMTDKNNKYNIGPVLEALAIRIADLQNEVKALKARNGKLQKGVNKLEELTKVRAVRPWYVSIDAAKVKDDPIDLIDVEAGYMGELFAISLNPYYRQVTSKLYPDNNYMVGLRGVYRF